MKKIKVFTENFINKIYDETKDDNVKNILITINILFERSIKYQLVIKDLEKNYLDNKNSIDRLNTKVCNMEDIYYDLFNEILKQKSLEQKYKDLIEKYYDKAEYKMFNILENESNNAYEKVRTKK